MNSRVIFALDELVTSMMSRVGLGGVKFMMSPMVLLGVVAGKTSLTDSVTP
jgi:hypothetical protein